MPLTSDVRRLVQEFRARNPIGQTAADAFPAWWLNVAYELDAQTAVAQCSPGSGDYGLDAFHLQLDAEDGPTLHLIQAKMSEDRAAIRRAVLGIERSLPHVCAGLAGDQLQISGSNPLFASLAAVLQRNEEVRPHLRLRFAVLHLCPDAEELLYESITAAEDRLRDAVESTFPDRTVERLTLVGPRQFERYLGKSGVTPPAPEWTLRFDGVELKNAGAAKYYAGLGRLSDLVELYGNYQDALFEKNVRLYLFKKAEKGPASYMKQTLREICVPGKSPVPPEHFAMFHNGVTLYAVSADHGNGNIVVRRPSVLNGCQTVKSAFFFRNDTRLKDRIDPERWDAVPIPLRIIVSPDAGFVRRVAVSNNRQNEIRPSAFFANEPEQVRLGERFYQTAKVFYERQEGAFRNLQNRDPGALERDFPNAKRAPLTMEELAQAIATVAQRPAISVAARLSSLFEESLYRQVFTPERLEHLDLLIFTRNVLRVMHLALTDIKNTRSRRNFEKLPFGRFRYPCTRIAVRYVVKHRPEDVATYGEEVLPTISTDHEFRKYLVRLLSPSHTGLQTLIPDYWGDEESQNGWADPYDSEILESVLKRLRLNDVDVFSLYDPGKSQY